jgi:hypothetical protein
MPSFHFWAAQREFEVRVWTRFAALVGRQVSKLFQLKHGHASGIVHLSWVQPYHVALGATAAISRRSSALDAAGIHETGEEFEVDDARP